MDLNTHKCAHEKQENMWLTSKPHPVTLLFKDEGGFCDALKPGGPLTTCQPAEYKWTSGYPTPLQKIGQSLLCTGSSTQMKHLHETCPKQSNICNIYPIRPLGPITVLNIHANYESNYISYSYKSYNIFTLKQYIY